MTKENAREIKLDEAALLIVNKKKQDPELLRRLVSNPILDDEDIAVALEWLLPNFKIVIDPGRKIRESLEAVLKGESF